MTLHLDYLPRLPHRMDWRIGCIGAGFIMRDCHLVAYRNAGFNPVAIASRTEEAARAVATQHGIPRVHATIDELLKDSTIEVLDIAVPPDAQPEIIRKAAERKLGSRHPRPEAAGDVRRAKPGTASKRASERASLWPSTRTCATTSRSGR